MIIKAEVINQPQSGECKERIYDISSLWNSQNWTWIKFTNDDLTEWCGNFRGSPRDVSVSKKYNSVLVLTSDYLYRLDSVSEKLVEYESQPQYQILTVTTLGDFILADYYSIEIIKSTLEDKISVDSPIKMDTIKFQGWYNNKLAITCDEFLNWDNHVELELDGDTLDITLKVTNKF
ncbi:hypothetical protein HZF08_27145 [Paenibacillus sp. CGMCC 1.16610]|uniref:Uncharacterized protein n=2 Tax=Paenibacillus TaxID=44249 RepID=A0ABW9UEA1_9BACL|nr:hypothetical protein [Paenibacillus anseongense]MBA2941971.1 hypothetical protein [Paenibacillus sp. CGMCC 1.16610]MVQ38487.1 hypothetical protein [Paenibacillus anseongense]